MKYFIIISVLFSYGTLNAQKFDYYFDKGQTNLDTGNYKLAITYYDSALKKSPKHASSYFNRGLSKISIDDNEGAILDFTKYITLVPNDGDAYSQRGDARKYLKDTVGCIKDYDSSLVLKPNDYNTRINRGRMMWAIDSMELSQKDMNYAVILDSTKFDGVYYKSITHYFMNQNDSALKYLTLSIRIKPGSA